jgi:hypothetical protein
MPIKFPVHYLKQGQGVVYHLLDHKGKILYIGSTVNVYARIGQHIKSKNGIHSVVFWEFPQDQLLKEEADQIVKYNPPLNGPLHGNGYWMTREVYQKINPIVKGKACKIRNIMNRYGLRKERGCLTIDQWNVIAKELEVTK